MIIYCATNINNSKRYIGQTMKGVNTRRSQHEYEARNGYGVISCTRYDLRTKYSLNESGVSELIKGKRKSHKGWRVQN